MAPGIELENFDRQYRVTIVGGGGGFAFGGEPFPLHISFSMQKTDLYSPNNGTLSVWNLSPEHTAMLIEGEENARLTLQAGYGDNIYQIFSGVVNFSSTAMDGADWRTDIEVIDTLEEQRDSYVSLSFAPGTNWRDIMCAAAGQLGIPIIFGPDVEFKSIDTGFQFVGLADDIFTKGCDSNALSWSVQDGIVQVKKQFWYCEDRAYVVSADTGMIEMPVRVCLAGSAETGDKIVGYEVTILLNADIHIDEYVYLDSRVVKGFYRVYSIDYSGDSQSGDWIMKLRLLELGEGGGGSGEVKSAVSDTPQKISSKANNRYDIIN